MFGAPQFLGVVAPIMRFEGEVVPLRPHQALKFFTLGRRPLQRRLPHVAQEIHRRIRRAGHGVVELEMGEAVEAEQTCPLGAQLHNLGDDGAVVGRAAGLAAPGPGRVGERAQIAAGGEDEERLDQRARQGDHMAVLGAPLLGGFRGGIAQEGREAGKVIGAVERQEEVALVGEHVLGELRAEFGQPDRDLGDASLRLRGEAGAGPAEAAEVALEHAALLRAQTLGIGVDRREAVPELRVQGDGARMPGELWGDGPFDRLQLRAGVAAREIEEHVGHPVEGRARPLHRRDGVVEGRRRLVSGDGRDLGVMRLQRAREGRHVMLGPDRLEIRQAEGCRPFRGVERVRCRGGAAGLLPLGQIACGVGGHGQEPSRKLRAAMR
ncbi:hypothetical protein GCM10025880_31720 [Methylorubrum aminovorans]|nr:hypothetical protein GCM10025880_31720 [Methylorubrum aminovorans]